MREELCDSGNVYLTDPEDDDPLYLFGECLWSGEEVIQYEYLVGFTQDDSHNRRYCIPQHIERVSAAIESYEFISENWGPISPSNKIGFVPPYALKDESCIICEELIQEPKDGVLMVGMFPVHPSCSGRLTTALDSVWDEHSGQLILDSL